MTIKEFFKFVPLENDMRPIVMGNGYFKDYDISGGRFVVVDKPLIFNMEKDYELTNVSIYNNRLCLEIDCR